MEWFFIAMFTRVFFPCINLWQTFGCDPLIIQTGDFEHHPFNYRFYRGWFRHPTWRFSTPLAEQDCRKPTANSLAALAQQDNYLPTTDKHKGPRHVHLNRPWVIFILQENPTDRGEKDESHVGQPNRNCKIRSNTCCIPVLFINPMSVS